MTKPDPPGSAARPDRAADQGVRQARGMTDPQAGDPQPRDIALEQETPEQAADLEAQSEPVSDRGEDGS